YYGVTPFGVTDEVEGNSVVPTYGDNRQLRPHQSQLTLRQRRKGMTATGSHVPFYSLRGAPPSRGSLSHRHFGVWNSSASGRAAAPAALRWELVRNSPYCLFSASQAR
ncbi:MAG: hypothetical protein PUH63_01380, partial [Firmicutes bacterium]|nr:hypothetical protein [Bacillota bacterium]